MQDGDRAADGSTSRACLERVEGGEPVLLARSRTAGRRLIVLGSGMCFRLGDGSAGPRRSGRMFLPLFNRVHDRVAVVLRFGKATNALRETLTASSSRFTLTDGLARPDVHTT